MKVLSCRFSSVTGAHTDGRFIRQATDDIIMTKISENGSETYEPYRFAP